MSFIRLNKLIPRAAVAFGMKRQIDAAHICEKYRMIAPGVIHADVLSHTLPKYVRKATLTIGVENGAWAERIHEKSSELLTKINAGIYSQSAVVKIRTVINAPRQDSFRGEPSF